MITLAVVVLALATLAQSNAQTNPRPKPASYDVPEAYEVYAALLPMEWTWRDAKAHYLVIQEETDTTPSFFEMLKPVRKCYPPAFLKTYGGVMDEFEKVNQEPKLLLRKLTIEKPYQLVPKSVITGFFKYDAFEGWQSFDSYFPEAAGYLDMSAVGFNPDKTQALVYIGHSCGSLCGGGTYHLLEKKAGKWEEVLLAGCQWVS